LGDWCIYSMVFGRAAEDPGRRSPAVWRLHLGWAVAVLVLAGVPGLRAQGPGHESTVPEEFRLKAAFVYRLTEFVEWPTAARTSQVICVLPPNPFGHVLTDLVSGETLHGVPLEVRDLTRQTPLPDCRVLFLPARAGHWDDVLDRVVKLPILTIGDAPDFLDRGGIVQLRVVNNRVRFDVNFDAARAVGLRVSAQLVRLAMHVRSSPS
jgi:hypothetical protein